MMELVTVVELVMVVVWRRVEGYHRAQPGFIFMSSACSSILQ
jgi:hypothetical protein